MQMFEEENYYNGLYVNYEKFRGKIWRCGYCVNEERTMLPTISLNQKCNNFVGVSVRYRFLFTVYVTHESILGL